MGILLSKTLRLIISSLLLIAIYIVFYIKITAYGTFQSRKLQEPQPLFEGLTRTIRPATITQPTKKILMKELYPSGYLDKNLGLCPDRGKHINVFIAITSGPKNTSARNIIRQTWGHYTTRKDISIGFMIGSTTNSCTNTLLVEEQYLYGDLVRAKFVDCYDNLTYKTISILDWISSYCSEAKFLLKTDDDMFIHVFNLLKLIEGISPESYAMYGRLVKDGIPFRNKSSKYYLPPEQYESEKLPPYLTGPAYLLPVKLSKQLLNAILNHPPFRLEDVLISGIIANKLNIKLIHDARFYNNHYSVNKCNIRFRISLHDAKAREQFYIWNKIHDKKIRCDWDRLNPLYNL